MTDPKALIAEARENADVLDVIAGNERVCARYGLADQIDEAATSIRRLADALERAEEALERDANDERYLVGYCDGYDAGWDEADAHYTKTAP